MAHKDIKHPEHILYNVLYKKQYDLDILLFEFLLEQPL